MDLHTAAEVAEQLGIAERTVRQSALNGTLAGRKIGTTWVFTQQAVDDYRENRLGRPGRRPAVVTAPPARARRRSARNA